MQKRRSRGQGTVEYCGALIMAALIVAAVLGGGVNGLSHIFSLVITSAQTMITSYIPS